MDTVVELRDILVMRVRADMKSKGPPAAFSHLESKLPSLKGRKFYGTFRMLADGEEEYYACVEMVDGDKPELMQLESGSIPGGKYAKRRIMGWERVVREGKLPAAFQEFVESLEPHVDHDRTRPCLEFYRSHEELLIFVPMKDDTPLREGTFLERHSVNEPSTRGSPPTRQT
jgi:hypothetical protein